MVLLILLGSLKFLVEQLNRIAFAIFLVALATIYVFNTYNLETNQAKLRPRFCTHTYYVLDETVPVCATQALSRRQVNIIDSRLSKSLELYQEFMLEFDREVVYTIPLTIYVMDVKTLNDKSIFGNKFPKRVVGRYTAKEGEVYISEEMFTRIGYTDLQHEIAHYGNDNAGIGSSKKDEPLALQFEKYYRLNEHK